MEEVETTVEEQDARLEAATKQLEVQIEAKRERARQLGELAAAQREFKRELEETLARLREKNRLLNQKKEALLVR